MPRNAIKKLLLAEDNPGDARLLREMLNEQVLCRTEVQRGDAEKHLVDLRLTFFCSTWDCSIPRDREPCRGLAPALPLAEFRTASYDRDGKNQHLRSGMGIEFTGIDDATQKWLALGRLRRQRN
jgi:hypothetical protein